MRTIALIFSLLITLNCSCLEIKNTELLDYLSHCFFKSKYHMEKPPAYDKEAVTNAAFRDLVFRKLMAIEKDTYSNMLSAAEIEKINGFLNEQLFIKVLEEFIHKPSQNITDSEYQTYYNTHSDELSNVEKRDISYIFFMADHTVSENTRISKMELAEKVYTELQNGADFAETAGKYSEADSARQGGALGKLSKEEIPNIGFQTQVFSMQEGEYSRPLYIENGYYLIKLNKIIPQHHLTLNKAKPKIKHKIEKEKRMKLQEKLFTEAKKSLKVYQDYLDLKITDTTADSQRLFQINDYLFTWGHLKSTLSEQQIQYLPHAPNAFITGMNKIFEKMIIVEYGKQKKLDQTPEYKSLANIYSEFLLTESYIEEWVNKHAITASFAKEYFETNKRYYQVKPKYECSIITIDADYHSPTLDLKKQHYAFLEAKKTADKIYHQLQNGTSFKELAKKYSHSTSAENGGYIGKITLPYKADIDRPLTGLSVGEISPPHKGNKGYTIVQLMSKTAAQSKTFEEVSKDETFIESAEYEFAVKQMKDLYSQTMKNHELSEERLNTLLEELKDKGVVNISIKE